MVSCSDSSVTRLELPSDIVERIFAHFDPKGRGIDPFKTDTSFYRLMDADNRDWCNSLASNRDFMTYKAQANYIMGCPPFAMFTECLTHGMCLANDVVLVTPLNRIFERKNVDAMADMDFTIREIFVLKDDKRLPNLNSHIGAVWYTKNLGNKTVVFDKGTICQPMLGIIV